MSTNPNDPFNNPAQPMGQPQGGPPQKSRGKGCLIGCGIASVVMLLVCCGGGYWMYNFVSGELGREVQRRVADNPVIKEHVGQLESVSLDLMETSKQSQQAQEEGKQGVLVFQLEGSQGSGQLLVEQATGSEPDFSTATLVLPNGTRHAIDASDPNDIDINASDLDMELEDLIDSGEMEVEFDAPSFEVPEVLEESEESELLEADQP